MSLLIGFVGGLFAIFAKGAVDYWFERRREIRALKSAARLVRDEIETAHAYADVVLGATTWMTPEEPFTLTTEAWDQSRELFASPRVNDQTWTALALAARAVRWLHTAHDNAVAASDGDHPEVSDDDAEEIEIIKSTLERAMDRLFTIAVLYPLAASAPGRRWIAMRQAWNRWRAKGNPSKASPKPEDIL